ncbi:hypothetical protein BCL79_1995 [Stenotrophomonas rhizophila]|uniref:Uncharacterized protein n=1 Tax=Stenotrophomonas rhizophila TaxID=216778 RepID=A0A498CHP1_9GAMM|nr:YeeE/YedE family protein [Stenotrophomonas rhizophila]RLK57588.1 hypothetical protein BCL79_1995 [Stenotrophomonas rhizophila]
MTAYWQPLFGGMLLGLSAVLLLIANGRIAGISGIVGRWLQGERFIENGAFVIGLVLGPVFYSLIFGGWPSMTMIASWPLAIVAGLFVGFGTRMGSGCTSGHGIVGLARLSARSIAAVAVFITAGIFTATVAGVFR